MQRKIVDFTRFVSESAQNPLCKVGRMPSMVVLSIEAGVANVSDSRTALPCPIVKRCGPVPSMAALGAAAPC